MMLMKMNRDFIKSNKGQSMVIFALLMTLIMGFAAIVIDVGRVSIEKSDLQNAADAAALAAARELPNISSSNDMAEYYAEQNGVQETDISVTTPYNGDSTKIEVVCTKNVKYTLARVLGFKDTNVSASAVAQYGIAASVPWIVPFVIPQPPQFDYSHTYVMRMYGAGPYPNGYSFPADYRNDPVYGNYSGLKYVYATKNSSTKVYRSTNTFSGVVGTIPNANSTVTLNRTDNTNQWYNITYSSITGWVQINSISKTSQGTTTAYPYQFDYMNVKTKAGSNPSAEFNEYLNYLKNGYDETFSVDQDMLYYAPSSGGKQSVDAFATRISRDSNTDYTKAQIGDPRVMLIPVVNSVMPRNTAENTPVKIIGFVAFFLEKIHPNSYGETFWFEGRFLENANIGSGDITIDPDADFGLRITHLVAE